MTEEDVFEKRVRQVAQSLARLRIVSNMDEALKRAREIVSKGEDGGKSIKELAQEDEKARKSAEALEESVERSRKELEEEISVQKNAIENGIESAKNVESELEIADVELKQDVKVHSLEEGDVKAFDKEVADIAHAVEDSKFLLKKAEEVQKAHKKDK